MNCSLGKITISVLMLSSTLATRTSAGSAQIESLVGGNTAFALDLYGHIKNTPGNIFLSPYSISTALAITYAGARNDTAKQMEKVFRFDIDRKKLPTTFGELQSQLVGASRPKGVELDIANALWAQKGYSFLPDFLEIAKGEYQANVNQADFITGAETA